MRVVMRAPFDRYSGYGNDAIDIALGLTEMGVDVVPWPMATMPGLPIEFARLLVKDPTIPPDTVLLFAPPFELRRGLSEFGVPTVGYTMWERTPMLPADFKGHGWRKDERTNRPLAWLDRLAVTCSMNVDALRPVVGEETPIDVIPCGIAASEKVWPIAKRDPLAPVRFLNVGMLNGRKNPFALLRVWKRLCGVPGWDGSLMLHSLAKGLTQHVTNGTYGERITLSQRPLSHEQMVAMYHDHDVFVSTSRGEGNNKPPMEFMATGGTVIASDWSGHQNWLSAETGYPVGGALVPADGAPGAEEFEIDEDALFETMLWVWEHRGEAQRKGQAAARHIRSACSWEAVLPRLARTLEMAR